MQRNNLKEMLDGFFIKPVLGHFQNDDSKKTALLEMVNFFEKWGDLAFNVGLPRNIKSPSLFSETPYLEKRFTILRDIYFEPSEQEKYSAVLSATKIQGLIREICFEYLDPLPQLNAVNYFNHCNDNINELPKNQYNLRLFHEAKSNNANAQPAFRPFYILTDDILVTDEISLSTDDDIHFRESIPDEELYTSLQKSLREQKEFVAFESLYQAVGYCLSRINSGYPYEVFNNRKICVPGLWLVNFFGNVNNLKRTEGYVSTNILDIRPRRVFGKDEFIDLNVAYLPVDDIQPITGIVLCKDLGAGKYHVFNHVNYRETAQCQRPSNRLSHV